VFERVDLFQFKPITAPMHTSECRGCCHLLYTVGELIRSEADGI